MLRNSVTLDLKTSWGRACFWGLVCWFGSKASKWEGSYSRNGLYSLFFFTKEGIWSSL